MNHLKRGSLIFLLALIELVIVNGQAPVVYTCPTTSPKCNCYLAIGYLICDKPDDIYKLDAAVNLDMLVLSSSKNLKLLTEKLESPESFKLNSLVITVEADQIPDVRDNLEALIKLPAQSIKITAATPLGISLAGLKSSLTSISLNNVEILEKFEIPSFASLTSLELNKVKLPQPVNFAFVDSTLTRIQITETANLKGIFSFKPKDCPATQKIYIELRKNANLEDFDFSQLFAKTPDCNYHIEISENGKIDPGFLVKHYKELNPAKPEQLYLVLHQSISCTCELWKFYEPKKDYIHSAKCADLKTEPKTKYLYDVVKAKDFGTPCT